MEFKESCQPTDDELRHRATIEGGFWPEQDFDIMVTNSDRVELFIELVKNDECRQRHFFLSCLYLLVGDAVRGNYKFFSRDVAEDVIARCQNSQCSPLELLATRAKYLMSEPQSFDYKNWCDGGFAYATILKS